MTKQNITSSVGFLSCHLVILWPTLLVCLIATGCKKDEPPRSGGRTASYWAETLQKTDNGMDNVEERRKAATKLGPLILTDPAGSQAC